MEIIDNVGISLIQRKTNDFSSNDLELFNIVIRKILSYKIYLLENFHRYVY